MKTHDSKLKARLVGGGRSEECEMHREASRSGEHDSEHLRRETSEFDFKSAGLAKGLVHFLEFL